MNPDANQRQPPPARVYRGRPENQRDPNAVRINPRESQETNPPPPPRGNPQRRGPPAGGLNKPTLAARNDAAKPQATSANPAEGSVFASQISVRETVQRQTFTPSAPALIEISRQTYAELLTDDAQLAKVLLPEYFDYYSTAMLWLRIVHLKQRNSQPLTQKEQDLLNLTQVTSFCVPEPLVLQLKQIGNITTMTKQHLYPEFPPFPTAQVANHGGYYGTLQLPAPGVNNDLHNLYEEIPCLGVMAEAVRQAISDAPAGPYQSALNINADNPVNGNLLGYKPLTNRKPEAKNLALSQSITPNAFPDHPEDTGFNLALLQGISSSLAATSTFKNTDLVFSTLSEVGAQSQTVIPRPIVQENRPNIQGETRPTSLSQEQPSHYGSAVFFDSQLMKEAGAGGNNLTWCCVNLF
ncbi:uncharacterized protein LOC115883781 [Sitophilus oryzae]|uniref:Uncharacterized protein LOC115883781 n=1 Tax=Sitophilus oryzae TaxID=7048 RepID=A0A6J2Y4W9_SITOR|nr:uncharacterized protein LOC115883781 [Sitophilus oryzae]